MTSKTLEARRAHAQAEIAAVDAQRAHRLAEVEAAAAEQEAERRRTQARTAELSTQLDDLGRYLDLQRQKELDDVRAELDRRDELRSRLKEVANMEIPPVRRSMAEYQAEMAQLDRYTDHVVQAERDKDIAYIDRMESRRIQDPAFGKRWALNHPGGIDGCSCPMHRAYRREE